MGARLDGDTGPSPDGRQRLPRSRADPALESRATESFHVGVQLNLLAEADDLGRRGERHPAEVEPRRLEAELLSERGGGDRARADDDLGDSTVVPVHDLERA